MSIRERCHHSDANEQTWVKSRLEGGQSVVFEHVQKSLCDALAWSKGVDVGIPSFQRCLSLGKGF